MDSLIDMLDKRNENEHQHLHISSYEPSCMIIYLFIYTHHIFLVCFKAYYYYESYNIYIIDGEGPPMG